MSDAISDTDYTIKPEKTPEQMERERIAKLDARILSAKNSCSLHAGFQVLCVGIFVLILVYAFGEAGVLRGSLFSPYFAAPLFLLLAALSKRYSTDAKLIHSELLATRYTLK